MNVFRLLVSGAIAAASVIAVAGVAKAQDAAKPAATASAASSAYKIGIVDRRAVLQGYTKAHAEREKLEADVEAKNKEIEKMSENLRTSKEKYDKERDALSVTEREEREAAFQKELLDYQSKVQVQQAEIDNQERRLVKRFFSDIDDAVQKIGEQENYHLIIDGSKGSSTLFYAEAINMSQKIIDYLNANNK